MEAGRRPRPQSRQETAEAETRVVVMGLEEQLDSGRVLDAESLRLIAGLDVACGLLLSVCRPHTLNSR